MGHSPLGILTPPREVGVHHPAQCPGWGRQCAAPGVPPPGALGHPFHRHYLHQYGMYVRIFLKVGWMAAGSQVRRQKSREAPVTWDLLGSGRPEGAHRDRREQLDKRGRREKNVSRTPRAATQLHAAPRAIVQSLLHRGSVITLFPAGASRVSAAPLRHPTCD